MRLNCENDTEQNLDGLSRVRIRFSFCLLKESVIPSAFKVMNLIMTKLWDSVGTLSSTIGRSGSSYSQIASFDETFSVSFFSYFGGPVGVGIARVLQSVNVILVVSPVRRTAAVEKTIEISIGLGNVSTSCS